MDVQHIKKCLFITLFAITNDFIRLNFIFNVHLVWYVIFTPIIARFFIYAMKKIPLRLKISYYIINE